MGIPGFFGAFVQNYLKGKRGPVSYPPNKIISGLYLDFNGLIYPVLARRLKFEKGKKGFNYEYFVKDLFNDIFDQVESIIKKFVIEDTFVIAIDGLVPKAKMDQQRQRRYPRLFKASELFDMNQISPGTEFMYALHKAIKEWIVKKRSILPPEVIYSSYKVPGEAEHKISDLLKDSTRFPKAHNLNGDHVIYGLDADLILISLLIPIRNIILYREDILASSSGSGSTFFKIAEFYDQLTENGIQIKDFVFLMSLIGNDFVPRIFTLAYNLEKSINTILSEYYNRRITIINRGQIDYLQLGELLTGLQKLEEKNVSDLYIIKNEDPDHLTLLDLIQDDSFETFRNYWYSSEFDLRLNGADDKEIADDFFIESSDIDEMSTEFIRGMTWVYQYYTKGYKAINKNWSYKFTRAPLIADLAQTSKLIKGENLLLDISSSESEIELSMIHQLGYIIPATSHKILPQGMNFLFRNDSDYGDLFPRKFIREVIGEFPTSNRMPLYEHVHLGQVSCERLHLAILELVPKLSDDSAPILRTSLASEKLFEMSSLDLKDYKIKVTQEKSKIAIQNMERERASKRENVPSFTYQPRLRTRERQERSEPGGRERSEPSRGRGRGRASQPEGRSRRSPVRSESSSQQSETSRGRASQPEGRSRRSPVRSEPVSQQSSSRGRGRASQPEGRSRRSPVTTESVSQQSSPSVPQGAGFSRTPSSRRINQVGKANLL